MLDSTRFRVRKAVLLAMLVAAIGVPSVAMAEATYETLSDNENNAHTGVADNDVHVYLTSASPIAPVEFNIALTGALPRYRAVLVIPGFDIDANEATQVSFNGVPLGALDVSPDNDWSRTSFYLPLALVQQGNNLVEVEFETTDLIKIKGGRLLIDVDVDDHQLIDAGSSIITAADDSIAADGAATTEVTLTTFNAAGDPLTAGGATVTLVTTLGTLGDVTDNGDGTYTATLTSSTTAGLAVITGTVDGIDVVDTAQVEFVEPTDPIIDAGSSIITAADDSIAADGAATTEVTLTTFDAAGDPLTAGGATVTLVTTLGTLGDVTDNGDGTYTATLTSSTTAGLAVITGTVDGIDVDDTAQVEFVEPTDPTDPTTDTDDDGVLDIDDLDDDNDGISDVIEEDGNGNDVDTDGDGTPDRLDLDTDNDTLIDETESGFPPLADNDSDGDGLDDTVDADNTGGADTNEDGADDVFVPRNTDDDSLPDWRDPNSDNDNLPDEDENGDFDNNGVPDYLEVRGDLETSVRGGGSSGVFLLSMLSALAVVRRKRLGKSLAAALGAVPVALAALPVAAVDYQLCSEKADFGIQLPSCWYVGAGVGMSRLDPDDSISEWDVDDKHDIGFKGTVGYHLLPHVFLEASYADLGAAEVRSRNPAIADGADVHYKTPAAWVGYLLLDPASRWNIYLKAGTAKLDTDAPGRVNHEQEHDWQFALSGGVQWRFSRRWFARAEVDSYDKDARAVFLTVNRYFGEDKQRPEPVAPAELQPAPVAVAVALPPAPQSPPPCKHFTGVLNGVGFDTAKATLTPNAKKSLDTVVGSLGEFNKMNVEIAAHTDSRGTDAYNMALSQRRAETVVGYLHDGGVASERMQAKSYGESRPIADNSTVEGQTKNRRVEIKPLSTDQCVPQ